jgi:pilus assembly protein CpaB
VRSRIIAAVAAILLAIVGVVLLTGYVVGADQRAMAGMKTTSVLVVTGPVKAGTPAKDLADLVEPEVLPAKAVAPGALTSLEDVAGKVATADLVAGELVLADRFDAPEKAKDKDAVEVPEDMQEISIMLESQRVVGSTITAGETVGVFTTDPDNKQTHQTLHQALVTRVEVGVAPSAAGAEAETDAEEGAGPKAVVVTLALSAPDAETLVWSQEIGTIWLSREPEGTPRGGTRTVNEGVLFR